MMDRWHIVVENEDNDIVGQFDTGRESTRDRIHSEIGSHRDLSIRHERRAPNDANLGQSLSKLSDNVVEWDDRLRDL